MKRLCAILAILATPTLSVADIVTPVSSSTAQPDVTIISDPAQLPVGGKLNIITPVYVGYTERFAASFAEFLTNIEAITDPNAIIGIDNSTATPSRTITTPIDLSTLNGAAQDTPYYIGTTSHITVTGPITPTRSPTGSGYNALYLAALHDGHLDINTKLGTDTSPVNTIVIGQRATTYATTGTVELSGSNSYTGGTQVLAGTLQIGAANTLGTGTVALSDGATLNTTVNATITNPLALDSGSTISGNGTFTTIITIGAGVNLIPGTIGSIAEIHFHEGLIMMPGAIWHIDLATTAIDTICVWNTFAIQGDNLIPITIDLTSMSSSNTIGALVDFNAAQTHTWTIAYRSDSITGFNPDYFNINADSFFQQNPNLVGLGTFSVEQINNTLALTFTPVPEPGTYALMALGLAALALIKYRRRA